MKDLTGLLQDAKNGDENAKLEYIDRFKPLLKSMQIDFSMRILIMTYN